MVICPQNDKIRVHSQEYDGRTDKFQQHETVNSCTQAYYSTLLPLNLS